MIKMYPDEEVIKTDSDNVFIHCCPKNQYRVIFNVGVQYFQISDDIEFEDAQYHARMLITALNRLKEEWLNEKA